jgi:hypothetical protein
LRSALASRCDDPSSTRPARWLAGEDDNSIYRFDSDMLVNAHAYGSPAAQSPVLHLRHLAGGWLFDHYRTSFERVWTQASPAAALAGRGSADGTR